MISYDKYISEDDLVALFLSVGWLSSLENPDRLRQSILNSDFVCSYWDNHELIGLVVVIDNGYIAFCIYLCVKPSFQGTGIGKKLLKEAELHYKGCRLILTTDVQDYYEKLGYENYGYGMQKYC